MKRTVRIALSALLAVALAGCGGGDKGGDTTPAVAEPAAPSQPAGEAADPAAAPADPTAAPAGGGLTEQVSQGEKVWSEACSMCHGDAGEGKGRKNPAVIGRKALASYATGADLLTYVKEKMPKDDPGSLSEGDYLAVTAWLLSKNAKLGETSDALTASSAGSIKLK